MNKTDPDLLDSQLKANENSEKKTVCNNSEHANDNSTNSAGLNQVTGKDNVSDENINNPAKISKAQKQRTEPFFDDSMNESTSVNAKVAKQITNPDLFKSDYRPVSNFDELSRNWENTDQYDVSNTEEKSSKPKIEINITKQEFTIKLNGRVFPLHPFNK